MIYLITVLKGSTCSEQAKERMQSVAICHSDNHYSQKNKYTQGRPWSMKTFLYDTSDGTKHYGKSVCFTKREKA